MSSITTFLSILFLTIITLCKGYPSFVQPEKEYIYNYHAKINIGTYKPATFASQFILDGKLHMQRDHNSVLMKLTDLTYKLYNGELNHHDEYESIALDIPERAEDLLKPFQIGFSDDGKIKFFAADESDSKFSRDLKKGLASLIQIYTKDIKYDAKIPYTFNTYEDSIYGNVLTRYTVLPEESDIIVQKVLDVQSSKNWIAYFGINDDDSDETLNANRAYTIDAHRKYTLVKNKNAGIEIKRIDAEGCVYVHLMKGHSDSQIMLVNQTLNLLEMKHLQQTVKIEFNERKFKDDLSYKLDINENDETLKDLSFGRNEFTTEQYKDVVYKILSEVVEQMKVNHLTMESPDLKRGQAVNRLLRLMAMLDIDNLEKMYLELEESKDERLQIYQQMIPLIGTRASIIFLRNLVRKEKMCNFKVVNMLMKMPFNLRMPSKKLLTEVEDLMDLDHIDDDEVFKTGVLSFATLVYKVHNHYLIKNNLIKSSIEEDLLEKYTLTILGKLKMAQDYSMQYLYMQALYNIRIGNVVKYLEPYVKGEDTKNHHLRYLAICASYIEVIQNEEYVYQVYWPIFADTTLDLELRSGALFTILSAGKPSKSKLYDIYWLLKDDPNQELYHFYYIYVKSIITYDKKEPTAELLNFMHKPYRHSFNGLYLTKYKDPKYGFGSTNGFFLKTTNTSKTIFIDLLSNMHNFGTSFNGIWLKVDGIDTSVLDERQISNTFDLFITLLDKAKEQKNLHVEYAFLQNDKIVQMHYFNHTTVNYVKDILEMYTLNTFDISYQVITQTIFPNDMGLASVFELVMPILVNSKFKKIPTTSAEPQSKEIIYHRDWQYQKTSHGVYGLSFYNSIADIWQGTERIQSNEIIADLNVKLSIVQSVKQFKIDIYNQTNTKRDKFAMRNYATTLTYIYKDVHNDLQRSNKNSQHFAIITKGDQYKKKTSLFQYDCKLTGLVYEINVFDTNHFSRAKLMEYLRDIFQKYKKNSHTVPFGYVLLMLQHTNQRLLLSPEIGTLGVLITAKPSELYRVDHVQLTLAMDQKLYKKELNSPILYNSHVNITMTSKCKQNKTMDKIIANINSIYNNEMVTKNFNFEIARYLTKEKLFKLCVTGANKFVNNDIMHNINYTFGTVNENENDNYMCTEDIGKIYIVGKSTKSIEQQQMHRDNLTYNECIPKHVYDSGINYRNSFECLMMKTSLRTFEYEVTSMLLIPTEDSRIAGSKWFSLLAPYYLRENKNTNIAMNSKRVTFNYGALENVMNVEIVSPTNIEKLIEIPMELNLAMNYYFSTKFQKLNSLGLIESCLLTDQHIYNTNNQVINIIDNEWMRIVQKRPMPVTEDTVMILVKKIPSTKDIIIKVKINEQVLEMEPNNDDDDNDYYKIKFNGEMLSVTRDSYKTHDWFSIGLLNDNEHTLLIHLINHSLYIRYDGKSAEMFKMITDITLKGICFNNSS